MIKTIWSASANDYDKMVNETIKEGYKLKLRDTRSLAPNLYGFYAELEKQEVGNEDGAVAALRAIKEFCMVQESCATCPLGEIIGDCVCDIKEPELWALPE